MQDALPPNVVEKAVALLNQDPTMTVVITDLEKSQMWVVAFNGDIPVVDACVAVREHSRRMVNIDSKV